MFDKKPIVQQIMDICLKLFEKAFNCNCDGNKFEFSQEQINIKHLPLLFALPGLIVTALTSLTGDKEYQNNIRTIKKALNNEKDYSKIYDILKGLIPTNPIPDTLWNDLEKELKKNIKSEKNIKFIKKRLRLYYPSIMEAFYLLLNPKSFQIDQQNIAKSLIFSLGNYFILACMIFKTLIGEDNSQFLTLNDIKKIMEKCNIKDEINIFWFSLFFYGFTHSYSNKKLRFISEDTSDETLEYKGSVQIPLNDLHLHKLNGEHSSFYYINKYQKIPTDYSPEETIGSALDINIFYELDYHLWQFGGIDEGISGNESLKGAYLFSEPHIKKYNTLENLVNRLYQITKKSSLVTGALINSWDDFIDDPAKIIDSNIDDYCDWLVLGILENRSTFEQLLRFNDLKRACLSLDLEIKNPKIKKRRKEFEKANDVFIPSEIRKKFLDADEEVKRFINSAIAHFQEIDEAYVLGQELDSDKKEMLSFFNLHKKEYPYLNLFDPSIIEKLNFEPGADPNTIRNNRRVLISALKIKLEYKDFKTTKLTKLLGLETGTEKYMKWTK